MKRKVFIIGGSILAFLAVCVAALFIFLQPKPEEKTKPKEMTLMVYMIGSDLEARGGAGTKDIEEMIGSGVDLEKANVIVYTGGSTKWHNDAVSKEKEHSLLELGSDGFKCVKTFEQSSMGEADNLSAFLNYAYTTYPANDFSLVMWNHGSGPLIGYGADMLYNNDSLTLIEMQNALKNSPFNKNNKLSFVGFDACLMASAELCCAWADYADYLIASQEVEPAFGWDYAFLKDLGKTDTVTLSKSILDTYFDTCENYYERKGYDDRDTTLSCMDLSKTGELKNAINDLFEEVSGDVGFSYNQLMYNRVNTRALGRASTGSEYDLVDLDDMATQLEGRYPEQAKAIKNIVDKMVVKNVTNAEKLCGVSLYYPFYNKGYFEKSWNDVYKEMNFFPEYTKYIENYSKKWLSSDLLESSLSSVSPSKSSEAEYVLELTEEQAENFASASYYILQKEGEELYTRVYTSQNITKEDNILTANFDGQILYGKDKFGRNFIPVAEEHDTVGDLTRYSLYANLVNERKDSFGDYDSNVTGHSFHIAANNKTKIINMSAVVPYDIEVDSKKLIGGKVEDADLSQWTTYIFLQDGHGYITRYDNGVIKPYDEWDVSGLLSANALRIGDDLEFVFAPLKKGEYCLIFEIADTQGNKYCSELFPITSDYELEFPTLEREEIKVEWKENEDKVKLLSEDNIEVYLTTKDYYETTRYVIEAVNNNDYGVFIDGSGLSYNNKYYTSGSTVYLDVPANSTAVDDSYFYFGNSEDLNIIDELKSLQFSIDIYTLKNDRTIIKDQAFDVILHESNAFIPVIDTDYYERDEITRGMIAEKQVLFEKNGIRATLMKMGGDGTKDGSIVAHIRFENTSDSIKHIRIDNFIFDGICVSSNLGTTSVPPGMIVDKPVLINADELDDNMITSVKNVAIRIRFMNKNFLDGSGGSSEPYRYEIKLKEKGSGSKFIEGEKLLYDENGVRVSLVRTNVPGEFNSTYQWYVSVINTSGKDLCIRCESEYALVNGKYGGSYSDNPFVGIHNLRIGNNEKTVSKVSCYYTVGDEVEAVFTLDFYDFKNEKLLWNGSKFITLSAKK